MVGGQAGGLRPEVDERVDDEQREDSYEGKQAHKLLEIAQIIESFLL